MIKLRFTYKPFLLLIFVCLLFQTTFSQNTETRWFKGNTHTHSYWSDGNDFPEMIIAWYKTHGYNFLSLSDHNSIASGEKWQAIPVHPFRQERFNAYLEKYGASWVVYKKDSSGQLSVKLKTFEEYSSLFQQKDKFLMMRAEELSDRYNGKPIHIGAVNIKELVSPKGGNSVTEVMQNNIDAIYAQRKRTGQAMFPHLNHPNFNWAIKLKDMLNLKGERFFEVYNGHPSVHNYGDSATMGTEELWDKLLIHYIKKGKPLIYGLATDDAHDHIEYRLGLSNPGRGWIMVKARQLTATALIEAMERGDFYATTGVELDDVIFKNETLDVQVKKTEGINYTIQFWGANKKSDETKGSILLKEVKGIKGEYRLQKRDLFVRAKIISSKLKENPYQKGDVETAWTQPVTRK